MRAICHPGSERVGGSCENCEPSKDVDDGETLKAANVSASDCTVVDGMSGGFTEGPRTDVLPP
jgi:hypothetical protein